MLNIRKKMRNNFTISSNSGKNIPPTKRYYAEEEMAKVKIITKKHYNSAFLKKRAETKRIFAQKKKCVKWENEKYYDPSLGTPPENTDVKAWKR